jgi:hypothetical protein
MSIHSLAGKNFSNDEIRSEFVAGRKPSVMSEYMPGKSLTFSTRTQFSNKLGWYLFRSTTLSVMVTG